MLHTNQAFKIENVSFDLCVTNYFAIHVKRCKFLKKQVEIINFSICAISKENSILIMPSSSNYLYLKQTDYSAIKN